MAANCVTLFARVDFHKDNRPFGIRDEDRFVHIYMIGKTGTGKFTLMETIALQDLERGNGFALIDPHGDLIERVAIHVDRHGNLAAAATLALLDEDIREGRVENGDLCVFCTVGAGAQYGAMLIRL